MLMYCSLTLFLSAASRYMYVIISSYPVGNRVNKYRDKGEYVTGSSTDQGNKLTDILAESSTTFTLLLAIFFPSCTGNMIQQVFQDLPPLYTNTMN